MASLDPGTFPIPHAWSATTSAGAASPTGRSTSSRSMPGFGISKPSWMPWSWSGFRCSASPRAAHRDRLRDPPSRAGEPPRPLRELRPGSVCTEDSRSRARGARAPAQPDPGRLGQGPSGLPPGLHQSVHPRRDTRAGPLVQRAPAGFGHARERRPHVRRVLHSGRAGAGARSFEIPTLVLHGTGDLRVPFTEGRLLASLIPGARLVPIESRNHLILGVRAGVAPFPRGGAELPRRPRRRTRGLRLAAAADRGACSTRHSISHPAIARELLARKCEGDPGAPSARWRRCWRPPNGVA